MPEQAKPETTPETAPETKPDKPKKSVRFQRRQARLNKLKAAAPDRGRVRVVPRDAQMRSVLVHPTGIAFREQGSIEWPLDQFTKRRLRDGTVTLETADDAAKRANARARPSQPAAPR